MNSRSKHSESSHAAVMLQVMKKGAVSPMVALVVLFALATSSLALDEVAAKATQNASQASDPQVRNGGEVNEGILPVPNYSGDLWSRSYLSGDWRGTRSDLAKKGIQADVQFVQIFQSVVDGGRKTGTKYGGTLDYNLTLDFDRMGFIPGGLVTFRGESRYGETVNGIAGPLLPANLDGMLPLTRELDDNVGFTITNLNYTQFLSEQAGVMIGKFDTLQGDYNEFASGRGVSQFMNYNLVTNAPGAYPVGYSVLGGGFFVVPSEQISIMNFLFTTQDSSTTSGFDNFDDGWTWNTEIYGQYELGRLPGGLMGGVTYSFDADFARLNGLYVPSSGGGITTTTEDETWSVYFNGWQYIFAEKAAKGPVDVTNGKQDYQGVGLFGRIAFADKDVNPVKFFASVGLGGRGVIPGRDNDTFGVGYFYQDIVTSRLADRLGFEDNSQGFEAYYNFAISPSSFLTSDIQVLDAPFTELDTAVVLGMRLKVVF